MPGANLPDINFFEPDKFGHMFVYGMLVFLVLRSISKSNYTINQTLIWYIVLGSSIYGIILECVQYFFSVGRYFENLDILANIIGSIIGGVLFWYLKRLKEQ